MTEILLFFILLAILTCKPKRPKIKSYTYEPEHNPSKAINPFTGEVDE